MCLEVAQGIPEACYTPFCPQLLAAGPPLLAHFLSSFLPAYLLRAPLDSSSKSNPVTTDFS